MAAVKQEAGLMGLATETLLSIYVYCDPGGVQALIRTCSRLRVVFIGHHGLIAKAHVRRVLGAADYRLAVTAVASRAVDPTDRGAVERFLAAYVRPGDWPPSNFRMATAAALPGLVEAAGHLVAHVVETSYGHHFRSSPGDLARMARTAYMIETAANLFHRMPGEDGALLWRAPHDDLVRRFWLCFSCGEIQQVLDYTNAFGQYLDYGKPYKPTTLASWILADHISSHS